MRNIIKFFVERSLLVNLMTLFILVLGGLSFFQIKKEMFPPVDFDIILIKKNYPGSSTEDVESLMTIPIEKKLKNMEGIKKMNALSVEGQSIFYLELDPDEDSKEILSEIKSDIDSIEDFPDNTKNPQIRLLKNKNRTMLRIALVGGEEKKLREEAKKLQERLEELPEVSKVELDGYRDEQIQINLKSKNLNDYQVTLGEVVRAIQDANLTLSAGGMEHKNKEIMARTVGEFKNLEDVEKVVIRSNLNGQHVRLSQLGKVARVFADEKTISRANGKKAIYLSVKKKFQADILKTSVKVKKLVKEWKEKKGKGIFSLLLDDRSFYVKRRLGVLTSNGIQGLALVLFVLILFLNVPVAIITSLGAPLAFLVSFIFMESLGLSINLISMFGLILVLGMLVDDSIIVAEYFYQKVEEGMDKKEAAIGAGVETIKPILATVLTTMMAFSSLYFISGVMGKFLWPIPSVVIICLLASLFECFFILPNHLYEFSFIKNKKLKPKKWFSYMLSAYGFLLEKAQKIYGVVVLIFFVVLVGSLFIAKGMRFELFPGDDARILQVNLKGKVGLLLEKTDEDMQRLGEVIKQNLKEDELESLRTWSGAQMNGFGNKRGGHYGSALIYLTQPMDRVRDTNSIVTELNKIVAKKFPDYIFTIEVFSGGPPKGKPVEVELSGKKLHELKMSALKVKDFLLKEKGVLNSEIDFEEGKKQFIFSINELEAKRLGISHRQIALGIRQAIAKDAVSSIREDDEDIDIVMNFEKEKKRHLKDS